MVPTLERPKLAKWKEKEDKEAATLAEQDYS